MAIPEAQLDTWAKQGSITGSSTTYATVKQALDSATTKYATKDFCVFLQGSYGNDTNIYAESDVDVVIRLDSVYHYDTSALTPRDLALFNSALSPGTYPYATFKADVTAALQNSFGAAAVKPGSRAINILSTPNRRSADVIVATEFRRYYSQTGLLAGVLDPQYVSGICFFTSDGERVVNYPKQHSSNCTAKHQSTNGWFKPMVRIFKNMRSKLVDRGAIKPGCAPSYFIEGLLFNVPDDKFGISYDNTFVEAFNWIVAAEKDTFTCANQQHYLVRDNISTCWPCTDCEKFLAELAKMWKNWS